MRVPSEGKQFNLQGISFIVTKTSGITFVAKGKQAKGIKIFNRGCKFTVEDLIDTKFVIISFRHSSETQISTIKAMATNYD